MNIKTIPQYKYIRIAFLLAWVTIFYNLLEGLVSVYFGLEDETLSLFGFGIDSFVEVISGLGIWHMLNRLQANPDESPDVFESNALKITGSAFYILTAGLFMTAIIIIYQDHKPITTFWGVIVSLVSILTMWLLIRYKKDTGLKLNSEAILADANCTKTCLYLSFVLLITSLGYELTGIGGLDSIGALIIAFYAFKEGREAFEKSKGKKCSCCHD